MIDGNTTHEAEGFVVVNTPANILQSPQTRFLSDAKVKLDLARSFCHERFVASRAKLTAAYCSSQELISKLISILLSRLPSKADVEAVAHFLKSYFKSNVKARIAVYVLIFSLLLSKVLIFSSSPSPINHRGNQLTIFPNATWPVCAPPRWLPVVKRNTFTPSYGICKAHRRVDRDTFSYQNCAAPLKCSKSARRHECMQFSNCSINCPESR